MSYRRERGQNFGMWCTNHGGGYGAGARGDVKFWQGWLRQPQRVWLRRASFQIHLWIGLAIGLYIVMLSITGSALVYRNELDRYFATPRPQYEQGRKVLTEDELRAVGAEGVSGLGDHAARRPNLPSQSDARGLVREGRRQEGAALQPVHRRRARRLGHAGRVLRALAGAPPRRAAVRSRGAILERHPQRSSPPFSS